MDAPVRDFEPELSREDRQLLARADELADLMRHPAWATYVQDCLEPFILDVQSLILNGVPRRGNGDRPLSAEQEQGLMMGARYILKTLILLRNKPEELLRSARGFREEFLPSEETDHARS